MLEEFLCLNFNLIRFNLNSIEYMTYVEGILLLTGANEPWRIKELSLNVYSIWNIFLASYIKTRDKTHIKHLGIKTYPNVKTLNNTKKQPLLFCIYIKQMHPS